MAEEQSSARLRAHAGAPTSGATHVRTRLTADFTVLANSLAQRPGSAVTVGVAAYILSVPDGTPVSITALCAHFTEGEILISRALRELEAAGYLQRPRERQANGAIRTRTYVHDVPPRGSRPAPPPLRKQREKAPAPETTTAPVVRVGSEAVRVPGPQPMPSRRCEREPGPLPGPGPSQTADDPAEPEPEDAPGRTLPHSEPDPRAVFLLSSLRIRDRRLILSDREVAELAPQVSNWLARRARPEEITDLLTVDLPERLLARPARILAYRLGDLPAAIPVQPTAAPAPPTVLPWQTCDGGCERAFRAAEPGRCRDCPMAPAAGSASTRTENPYDKAVAVVHPDPAVRPRSSTASPGPRAGLRTQTVRSARAAEAHRA